MSKVGDWVERSGKRLRYVYATHGHGDHWFGTAEILKRFPGAPRRSVGAQAAKLST
ncbi:MBL fold metallo-hydrolase [Micromonospora avicenniae]|uniref:MBL fold metallo-hydrolase n=1 Tax=Micromonospora avicenniae TaxID=1198245 RepID=UPI001C37730A